jgi:hypothetical protein
LNISMKWLKQFKDVEDYFMFVSHGNNNALDFYKRKGFSVSHDILDGFITVLQNNKTRENITTLAFSSTTLQLL